MPKKPLDKWELEYARECYKKDGQPTKCVTCGCSDIDEIVEDRINYIPCEKSFRCRRCGTMLAYWAYGSFDPAYNPHEVSQCG